MPPDDIGISWVPGGLTHNLKSSRLLLEPPSLSIVVLPRKAAVQGGFSLPEFFAARCAIQSLDILRLY